MCLELAASWMKAASSGMPGDMMLCDSFGYHHRRREIPYMPMHISVIYDDPNMYDQDAIPNPNDAKFKSLKCDLEPIMCCRLGCFPFLICSVGIPLNIPQNTTIAIGSRSLTIPCYPFGLFLFSQSFGFLS